MCTEKERIRKQRYRNKLKAAKTVVEVDETARSPMGSYKTKRTLKKALNKVIAAMPESTTKKQAVVRQLVKNIFPSLSLEVQYGKE